MNTASTQQTAELRNDNFFSTLFQLGDKSSLRATKFPFLHYNASPENMLIRSCDHKSDPFLDSKTVYSTYFAYTFHYPCLPPTL